MLAVKTGAFEGPLDLLLHLIESEDLDITAVSLVQVTDQYIGMLRAQDSIDLRALADFVAVGAKLLFLKSRALLPRTPDQVAEDEREAEAIAMDLTAQLEEYRAFKSAASYLRELDDASHRSFVRVAPPPHDWLPTGLENVTMSKLLRALSRALERLPPETPPEPIHRQPFNVAERRVSILAAVKRRGGRLGFSRLIAECRTRLEAIITFLAVLDLLKTDELQAVQDASFGEIVLHSGGHSPQAAASASA
ncbi:MAG TPA: segregation/condensation protein A [Dehalococcoidia bacterium]|nr:segregation/condensation protein A [Dehalococcoidia bacterium]